MKRLGCGITGFDTGTYFGISDRRGFHIGYALGVSEMLYFFSPIQAQCSRHPEFVLKLVTHGPAYGKSQSLIDSLVPMR